MATNKIYPFGALTGGIDDSYLDYFPVADLVDGDQAIGKIAGILMPYHYDASYAGAESSPHYIIPDDNVSGTGAWVLDVPGGAFSHVEANRSTSLTLTETTETDFVMNNEVLDTLGEYNPATGVFTATYTGRYLFCGGYVLPSTLYDFNNSYTDLYVKVGSTYYKQRGAAPVDGTYSSYGAASFTRAISLSATNTAIFIAKQSSGTASINTSASADFQWITIDRLA